MEIHEGRAVVIGVNELALALSDIEPALKVKAGIHGLTIDQIASLVADIAIGAKILQDLGANGAYYVKEYNGKQYVILRGHAGLRPYLKGTKYLANNPRVVRLGLGPAGAASALKVTVVLSLTMFAADIVAQYIAGDGATLEELSAGLLSAGGSTVLSVVAGGIASAAAGTVFTAVFPVFLAGAVAGATVSYLYSSWEQEHNVTRNFVRTMNEAVQRFFSGRLPANEVGAMECVPGLSEYYCDPRPVGQGGGSGEGPGSGTGSGDANDPDDTWTGSGDDYPDLDEGGSGDFDYEDDDWHDDNGPSAGEVGENADDDKDYMITTPKDEDGEPIGPSEAMELPETDVIKPGDGSGG